jgi:hypothetical protein
MNKNKKRKQPQQQKLRLLRFFPEADSLIHYLVTLGHIAADNGTLGMRFLINIYW